MEGISGRSSNLEKVSRKKGSRPGTDASSRPGTRTTAPPAPPGIHDHLAPVVMTERYNLRYAFDAGGIAIPVKMFYDDYLSLFPTKDLDFRGWRLGPAFFRFIAENSPNIRTLLLDDAYGITPECIETLRGLPKLAMLSMKNTLTITPEMGKTFGTIPCLAELNISDNETSVKVFQNIAMYCKSLRTLTCQGCAGMDDFACQAIGECIKRFRTLKHLDFSRCVDFTDEGLLHLLEAAMHVLESLKLVKCKVLTSLSLAGLRKTMPNVKLIDVSQNLYGQTAYEFVSEGCRFLTHLNVTKCPEFDDVALAMMGRRLKHLQHLDMGNCFKVTDDGIGAFYREFEGSLVSLNITNCSHLGGPSAVAISSKAETLQDLRMNGVSKITSEALRMLWTSCTGIVKFEMAVDLRTTTTHRRSMVPHISDDTVRLGASPMLETIKLTGAVLVTDIGANLLSRRCPHLSNVDVSYCGGVSDKFLEVVSVHSSHLTALNVSGCPHVTDAGMKSLSEGACRLKLKKLEVGGCTKLTDSGVESIGLLECLELLVLRSCDNVTNKGIKFIAEGCVRLRSFDISSLDLVDNDSISLIVQRCLHLTNLVCESCTITARQFARTVAPTLPLSVASPARCKVGPRPREVVAFNKYVLKQERANKAARCMQKLAKVMHKWAWIWLAQRGRKKAAIDIQRVLRGHQHRLVYVVKKAEQEKFYGEVDGIQRAMRSLIGIRYSKMKTNVLRSEHYARALIQRVYRGHMARKRTTDRFARLWHFYEKFGMIAYKWWLVAGARSTRMQVLRVQRWWLMRKRRRYYLRLLFRTKMVQNAYRCHYARNKVKFVKVAMELEQRRILDNAASKIQTFVRAVQFNRAIIPFLKNCGQMFQDNIHMELWYIVRIQVNFRAWKGRMRAKYLRERPIVEFKAATRIQSWYKPIFYKVWFARFMFLKRLSRRKWANWLSISSRAKLHLAKIVRPIQRSYRQRLFLFYRERAASKIQKVGQGFLGRRAVKRKQFMMLEGHANRIKRGWRRSKGYRFRKQLMAIEHMAAWRIQRMARSNFDKDAMRRIVKGQAKRKYEDNLAHKKALLYTSRTKVVEKIAREYRNLQARKIQRVFRQYKKEKQKRRDAEIFRLKTQREARDELAAHKRGRALAFLPDPVKGAKSIIRGVKELMKNPNKIVSDADRPKLINGILTHQTLSLVQEGVMNLHLTLGQSELDAFQMDQDFHKHSREPFFQMIPGDLSGRSELKMHLWAKFGSGNECICKLKIGAKPNGLSAIARRERETNLHGKGIKLCDHDQVHVEFQGEMSVKIGNGGFAIDGITICQNPDEADEAKKNGYTLVCDLMRYNLPTSVWDHKREPYDDPDMYKMGALPKMEWMDPRLKRCLQAFNLSEEDILMLRNSFEMALGEFISEVIETKDVLKYWNFPKDSRLAQWVFAAVNPRKNGELTFSEYVHVVCYFCMFGKRELVRFVFGQMDTEKKFYLKKREFNELLEILAEFTMRNPKKWMLSWNQFMNPALGAIFLPEYEAFTVENPSTLWMLQDLQKKIMEKNLGEFYWHNKVEQFMHARKEIGVKMV